MNPWMTLVKQMKKENPKLSLKDVLIKASKIYKGKK